MINQKGLEAVCRIRVEKDFGKPIDRRYFFSCFIKGGAFITKDKKSVPGNTVNGLDPSATKNGDSGKSFEVKRVSGGFRFTLGKIQDRRGGETVGQKGKVNP